VDADQVASLARWLQDLPQDKAEATIALRMARADSLAQMLDDPDSQLPEAVAARGCHLRPALPDGENLNPEPMPPGGPWARITRSGMMSSSRCAGATARAPRRRFLAMSAPR
jgi:hypothetical protein